MSVDQIIVIMDARIQLAHLNALAGKATTWLERPDALVHKINK